MMAEPNPYHPPATPGVAKDLARETPSPGLCWSVVLASGFASLLLGILSRSIRPLIPGPIHYEAIASLFLQILLILAVLVYVRRRELQDGLINLNAAICMSWLAFFVGWTVIHGSVWDDIVSAVVTAWFISVAASSLAFFLWTLRRGGQQTKG